MKQNSRMSSTCNRKAKPDPLAATRAAIRQHSAIHDRMLRVWRNERLPLAERIRRTKTLTAQLIDALDAIAI